MKRVENKVVVVTGGALGIGRETCLLLASEGARVAITDILDEEGEKLAATINDSGGVARYWHLDVSKEEEVAQVYEAVYKEFGRLDATVNNAGITGPDKKTHEFSEADWDKVMGINLKGVFFCTKHAIPYMKKTGGGSIVNLSSIFGLVGGGDRPPYPASKGAVRLMSKNDAIMYAQDNIRVNSLHPGFIWTPMIEKLEKENPGYKQRLEALHPVGHLGEARDIAYGILFLVSDESKFMTGSELVIDGGYTCR
ncbi:MAG TPA: glucose 1-dehydrogenase [Flammeovirgaceae bacterium]|nr:glucose 1-dehydrogenase [Flammeovirgaceae bacterium]